MRRYEINSPAVSGEIVDGEAIIMHLGRGHYFSAEGSGALLWAGIEQRRLVPELIDLLVERYSVSPAKAEEAVNEFVEELLAQDLVRISSQLQAVVTNTSLAEIEGAYAVPHLEIYTDMQDLLLLDPIHDVDEVGWPIAAAPVRA